MAVQVLKDYRLGDMIARYLTDERRERVGFVLLPADLPVPSCIQNEEQIDSLVQIKLAGDTYDAQRRERPQAEILRAACAGNGESR